MQKYIECKNVCLVTYVTYCGCYFSTLEDFFYIVLQNVRRIDSSFLFTCIIVRKYIADCPQGFYGKNCSTECSLNCHVFSDCDRSTGQCKRGCKQGWTGNTCDQSK